MEQVIIFLNAVLSGQTLVTGERYVVIGGERQQIMIKKDIYQQNIV